MVAIANNTVDSVYLIDGIAEHGDNLHLGSPEHQTFEQAMAAAGGRQAVPAVKFAARRFNSIYIGRNITNWKTPINPVAKFGDVLFETVELL